jgi:hypothetical protein
MSTSFPVLSNSSFMNHPIHFRYIIPVINIIVKQGTNENSQ